MIRPLLCLLGLTAAVSAAEPAEIHLAHGLWHQHYRLEEALAHAGGAILSHSWANAKDAGSGWPGPARQGGGWLGPWPEAGMLARQDLLLAANVPSAVLAEGKRGQVVVDWVSGGGVLLLLGGRHALGAGHRASALDAISPATVDEGPRFESGLQHVESGLAMSPGPDAPAALAALDWSSAPRVYWLHRIEPRAGAEIWLEAGGQPLLVVGTHAQGRVALFAGSVLGEAPSGELAFWDSAVWPRALGAAIRTLLGESVRHAAAPPPASGQAPPIPTEGAYPSSGRERHPELQTEANRAYQRALLATLQSGDPAPAADLVAALVANRHVELRAAVEQNKPKPRREAAQQGLAALRAFQLEAYRGLGDLPAAVRPAVAEALAAWPERRVVELALAFAAGRRLDPAERAAFRRSPQPALQALGED